MARSLTVRRSAPGVALGVGGLIAVATGLPLVGLVAVVALLALTPWASSLAVRGMAGLLLVLAAGAVAVQLTGVRWGTGAVLILVGALAVLQLIVATARRGVSLVPSSKRPTGWRSSVAGCWRGCSGRRIWAARLTTSCSTSPARPTR